MATATSSTRKPPARKRAPKKDSKAVTVKLSIQKETANAVQFLYNGTAAEPFVKAVYITKDALITMGEDTLTVGFKPYVQTGKQKPQSKSAIRYSGDPETIRDLYVNRAQAEKLGLTNDSKVKVAVVGVSDDTISLTVSAA